MIIFTERHLTEEGRRNYHEREGGGIRQDSTQKGAKRAESCSNKNARTQIKIIAWHPWTIALSFILYFNDLNKFDCLRNNCTSCSIFLRVLTLEKESTNASEIFYILSELKTPPSIGTTLPLTIPLCSAFKRKRMGCTTSEVSKSGPKICTKKPLPLHFVGLVLPKAGLSTTYLHYLRFFRESLQWHSV